MKVLKERWQKAVRALGVTEAQIKHRHLSLTVEGIAAVPFLIGGVMLVRLGEGLPLLGGILLLLVGLALLGDVSFRRKRRKK